MSPSGSLPVPFRIFPFCCLALPLWWSAARTHESRAKELDFCFTEVRDPFCHFSFVPIWARFQAIE